MKKRTWLVLAGLLLFVLLCWGLLHLAASSRYMMNAAQLDQWVGEALPYGSTRKQVEAWLDAQHIERDLDVEDANAVSVRFTNPMEKLFYGGQTRMVFMFGGDDKLIDRTVSRGP